MLEADKWYLDRIEDPNGNLLTITYTSDRYGHNGLNALFRPPYPSEIRYSGHVSGLEPVNSIRFEWEKPKKQKILGLEAERNQGLWA